MKKEILQQFIDQDGSYLIGQRYVKGMGAAEGKDEWYAVFLSPNVGRELWNKKVGELPYDVVEEFANREIMTNIHLGGTYSPFQHGIIYKDFISLRKVECNPNELIHRCFTEKLTDYHKILELMEEMSSNPLQP